MVPVTFSCVFDDLWGFPLNHTSWNSTWSISITIASVMGNKNENENYLPDLPNEKSGEQLVFDQKVFRCNEAFVKKMNDLIAWFKSPTECRVYPKNVMTNHHWYRAQVRKYFYDERKSLLYKIIKNSDGIGE